MSLIDYYPLALLIAILALALPRFVWWAVIGLTASRLAYIIYLWEKRPDKPKETKISVVESLHGILELAPGTEPLVDIVAIHGLGGRRESSWTKDQVLWLRDLLGKDIPRARILTYGYDSRYSATFGSEQLSRQTIYDHAEALLSRLALYRMETPERPIVFVAHSFGGLVLKYALIHASLTHKNDLPQYKQIELSTYGINFLGTPHQGSEDIPWFQLLLDIQSIYFETTDVLAQHLVRDSEQLQQQLSQYTRISSQFHTNFFYETRPTRVAGVDRVLVPKASAVVPGAVNAESIAIYENHVDMVKFSSEEDEGYKTLRGHLSKMVRRAPEEVAEKWRRYKERS